MSFLDKIRSVDSKIGINKLSIFLGSVLLLRGVAALFLAPSEFLFDQTTLVGDKGAVPIPLIITTLLGWILACYGILNTLDLLKYEKTISQNSKFVFLKKLGLKNTVFIFSTIMFVLIISAMYVIVRPDAKLKTQQEEFENTMNEINLQMERIQSITDSIKLKKQ